MTDIGTHLFDTHTHLNHRDFAGDLEAVLRRAREAGVERMLVVGFDLPSSEAAVELAEAHEGLYASVGVHPHDAKDVDDGTVRRLRELAESDRVMAVGEIGLDFYRDLSPRGRQRAVFQRLIGLALDLELPIIVHDREAHEECLAMVKDEGAGEVGGVFHCFSGDAGFAQRVARAGFHVGLDGPITYPPRKGEPGPPPSHAVAQGVPLDRLLLETDCPWLPPQRYRGKRNEPAYVVEVAAKVAELRGVGLAEVGEATTATALRLFGRVQGRAER